MRYRRTLAVGLRGLHYIAYLNTSFALRECKIFEPATRPPTPLSNPMDRVTLNQYGAVWTRELTSSDTTPCSLPEVTSIKIVN